MMTTNKYIQVYLPQIQDLVELLKGIDPKSWCLAGGACRKYFENKHMGNDPNDLLGNTDFDVFVFNPETFKSITLLLSKTHQTSSGWNMSLVKWKSKTHPIKKIDVIYNPKYRSAAEVIEDFDLRCCQCYFQEGRFISVKEFLDDILAKKLVISNIHRPYSTLNRLMRYSRKGYHLTEDAAAEFFDHIRILGDEEFDYSYSITDPNQFSYQHYEEENTLNMTQSSVVLDPTPETNRNNTLTIGNILDALESVNRFSRVSPYFTGINNHG